MEILLTALVLGLMGSFHCLGMCGAIALSIPLQGSHLQKISGGILYNIGRTVTYGMMGVVFGLIGQGFQLMGFQRWVSIIMGSLMVLTIIVPSLFRSIKFSNTEFLTGHLRKAIGKLFSKKSYGGLFLIGLLNGLLPCGLVYMAVAGAIGAADLVTGVLFMILFGLGTIPMLLFINLAGNIISLSFRNKINRTIPYIVVVVGIIFILRGLSLGIPYLSPPKQKLNPEFHMKSNSGMPSADMVKGACCEKAEDQSDE